MPNPGMKVGPLCKTNNPDCPSGVSTGDIGACSLSMEKYFDEWKTKVRSVGLMSIGISVGLRRTNVRM